MALTGAAIERSIRGYFAACNAADKAGMMACFTPGGTHYFPSGSPFGVLRGAEVIADFWVLCVAELGSRWTVDNLVIDCRTRQAVIEWTHFKTRAGQLLRGDEWYRFNEAGKITEIRAYYACPAHEGTPVHELGGFDYAARGYPLKVPKP